jgi:signal transduction histidine kinase
MDHLAKLRQRIRQLAFGLLFLENMLLLAGWYVGSLHRNHVTVVMLIGAGLLALALSVFIMLLLSNLITQPLQALWQTILHLSPSEQGIAAPQIDKLLLGKELVKSLSLQIYQFADVTSKAAEEAKLKNSDITQNFVAQNLPLPLFIMDASDTLIFANEAAVQYIGIAAADLIGKNVYMVLDMSFPSDDTFDNWLKQVKNKKATATASWERVRLNVRDNHPARLFDLAAYYNRDNSNRMEVMVALFDHTKQYSQDDQAVSFIALSVHELRTPLTLLRGYIEVIQEEINAGSDPELQSFMEKMRSQAEQLMAFVNNILNVARVDDDQLQLHLEKGDWATILKKAISDLSLRAKVRDITLHCRIATDLPPVGVDRLSIHEVVNNLVDNAIKYSGTSRTINIESKLNGDGLIETTVQDFGLGISTSIMPNLFTKFYRDHRNRAQIGGTGLGLYLSKAIVTAHGGTISVSSHEGEGSTFGFTLLPYDKMTEELKQGGDQEITRSAHGWIKNHSLYRR